ncbi:MAG TPA: hypothetical protein VIU62_15665 [Chloroflexota bacterium]
MHDAGESQVSEEEREQSLEQALARTEADADAAFKAAHTVASALKKYRTAAHLGNLRDLRSSIASAEQALSALQQQVEVAKEGWDFDEHAYFANGAFARELLATARRLNVQIFEQDELLYSYPSLIKVLTSERAVSIDKTRERRLRPSILVTQLKDLQQRPARFRPQEFLESLAAAYKIKVLADKGREGLALHAVVTLRDIHRMFTLMPGMAREYTLQEFARDFYLLDQSGERKTKDGLSLYPSAATGTKGARANTLKVITQRGEEKLYYGLAFEPA